MALFLSTFPKKIDRKGRVSVPSAFRAVLAGEAFGGVVAYGSFLRPCIEVCGMSRLEALSAEIDRLDVFSEERDAFATAILGGATPLPFDNEGRIALPEALLEAGGIAGGEVVFVGKGQTFEMWNPPAFADYAAEARKLALARRGELRRG